MMCVAGKSSQEGPGSHVTRRLSEARGTLLPERPVGSSQGGCGIALAGCGDGAVPQGAGSRAGNGEGGQLRMGRLCSDSHP